MCKIKTENILNYSVSNENEEKCLNVIQQWIDNKLSRRYFVCANPHSIQVAESDNDFKKSLMEADLVTPDGVGIVFASKILGGNINNRVTGSDVFLGLSNRLNFSGGKKYFFLGSTEEVLQGIKRKMKTDYPCIEVAGTYSPPFKAVFTDDDNQKMIDAINAAQPDVLWVGMTAPKQEKWIYQNKDKLNVCFIGAIGAVFDFYVGRIKRSNPIFLRLGLEWLPRLIQEPRRLWRRNFISNPSFMFRILKEKFRFRSST